jgi:hypothetical protein
MRKPLLLQNLLLLTLSVFQFSGCEKQEKQERYDLFPLNLGNEFYYNYHETHFNGITAYTDGTETWKVVSVSTEGNTNTYTFERRLNAILKVAGQTIIISDSIRHFEVNEDKSSYLVTSSSMMLNQDLSFERYQSVSPFEIKHNGYSTEQSWSYLFKADSGLTLYTYYHPPNQIVNETITLDSLKLIH